MGKSERIFNIKNFGAAGDGCSKDTRPIQQAIDDCSLAGGGVVFVPPGTYLTGTLYLKDNICLDISPGAVLLGSTDAADYSADDFCPQNRAFLSEKVSGAHLITGVEVKNITIRGGGRIDGSGPAFFAESAEHPEMFEIPGWRPGQMIFLCECENVRIEGVELFNAPYWTCFLHGCESVFIHGVRVWNDRRTPNGDGIDIDCCRQVILSDCLIEGGDDCVTLRGNVQPLKNPKPCENVLVNNCILKTRANGIRVGVGHGIVRHATFSNLIIGGNALNGICIQSNYHLTGQNGGVEIHDLQFEDIQMPDVCAALYVNHGYMGGKKISSIYFHNLHALAKKGSVIKGTTDNPLCRIVLSGVDIRTSGRAEYLLAPERWETPVFEWEGCMPSALYMADCDDVEMRNCRLDWDETTGVWRYALWGKRLTNFRMRNCRLQPPSGGEIALQLDECHNTDIAGLEEIPNTKGKR